MKVSKTASAMGIRGELGWMPIAAEIAIEQMKWWAKTTKMPESRWPRIAAVEMVQ